MQYKPDPFFEAESVGPQITFGVSESTDLSVTPDAVYGKGWDVPGTATAPPNAARAAYLKQFPEAITSAEAEYIGKTEGASVFPRLTMGAGTKMALAGGVGAVLWLVWRMMGRKKA